MADGVPTWEEVARDHGRFLYNVAYRLAGNNDDAQDLVQEALIRVRKGLERYQLAQNNPNLFSSPRLVRFGLRTSF